MISSLHIKFGCAFFIAYPILRVCIHVLRSSAQQTCPKKSERNCLQKTNPPNIQKSSKNQITTSSMPQNEEILFVGQASFIEHNKQCM